MKDLILRKANSDDLQTLLVFEQSVLEAERPFNTSIRPQGASYYDLTSMFNDDKTYLLVSLADNKIIGSGYAQLRPSKISSLVHQVH